MRCRFVAAAAVWSATAVFCQDPVRTRPTPEAALAEKLSSPFLRHARWTVDYDDALQLARDEQKLVFGYFTTAYY